MCNVRNRSSCPYHCLSRKFDQEECIHFAYYSLDRPMEMKNEVLNRLNQQTVSKLYEDVKDDAMLHQWRTEMLDLIDEICKVKVSDSTICEENNTSLDPNDWISARSMAHKMLDSSLDYLEFTRNRPAWQSIPNDVIQSINDEPLPKEGQSFASVYDDTLRCITPYARGTAHPRFWGWVSGQGTFGGILAHMVEATLNINVCSDTSTAAHVEQSVIEWMLQIFSFPQRTGGGLLVSGTSIATIITMAAARQRIIQTVREEGLINAPKLIAYASTETHACIKKALELIGLGSTALHLIPVDENFRIKIDDLQMAMENDRKNGLTPFCIIGNAGTVNTGAFDNLLELSMIARKEDIWFHVDGAFGSFIILDPERRHLVAGIDQADSLAFDFHKWLHCPYDVGCILVRDYTYLQSTFVTSSSYMSRNERKQADNKPWFFNMGLELSRPFRALKVWFTLKEHGVIKLGRKIADNCAQAQYLVSLLEKHPHSIRILRPSSLNIVNFRFEPEELNTADDLLMNSFNEELLKHIHLSGIAVPSSTFIQNRFYIRVCFVNHRTVLQDVDLFFKTILDFSENLLDKILMKNT